MRRLRYIIPLLLLAGFIFGGYQFMENGAPYAIIKPRRITSGITPDQIGLQSEHFKLETCDSLKLDCFYTAALRDGKPSDRTLILLHGIGGNKQAWVETSKLLNEWGYNTLLYDARAHGASEGLYCTLGYYEKYDVSTAIDWLLERNPDQTIGIMGNSMGGAVSLQALAYDSRLAFGLIECAFSDLRSVVHAYQQRYAQGFALPGLTDEALEKAGQIAQFDPGEVCPVCVAPMIKQPVMLLHGSEDINIPPVSMDEIYEALGSEIKEKHLIKGADHYTIMQTGGDTLLHQMKTFLERASEKSSKQVISQPQFK